MNFHSPQPAFLGFLLLAALPAQSAPPGPKEIRVALQARHFNEALAASDKVLASSPWNEEARYLRARALEELGRFDEADEALARVAWKGSKPLALKATLRRAELAFDLERDAACAALLKEVQARTPEGQAMPDQLYLRLRLDQRQGRELHTNLRLLEEACLREAVRAPKAAAPWCHLSLGLSEAGQGPGALSAAAKALALEPSSASRFAQARALLAAGRAAESAAAFEALVKEEPRAGGWLWLGRARKAAGDPEGARKAWEEGLNLAPWDLELKREKVGQGAFPGKN